MGYTVKLFPLVLFITFFLSSRTFSQTDQPQQNSEAVKKVAIYSSKKTFFKNYPIDSIVSNLNSLNTNKKIVYYIGREGNNNPEFKPDYVVDLNVLNGSSGGRTSPDYRNVRQSHTTFRYDSLRKQEPRTYYTYERNTVNPNIAPLRPDYEIKLKITPKNSNERTTRKVISEGKNKETGYKLSLIIDLIKYLLTYFSK